MTGRIGPYEIRERVGRGGMGEIFTARDPRLDRIVVLKTISPDLLHDERMRQRFLVEARAAAALTHPFICTIHEVFEHDSQPVIVMEYVEGETLGSRLGAGPFPAAEVCRIGAEVAEALSAAHQRGIIHRDISAANIMLTASGHAKVMDFGLAHLAASAETPVDALTAAPHEVTAPGTVLGTPAFVAPEVLRGRRADARSDLYSLGVVLYQISTGRLPFTGATTATMIADILDRTPPAPRSVRPEVPPGLDRVIMRLLAKNPDDRYAHAADVAVDLRASVGVAPDSEPRARSIAVLPFKDLAQDAANAHIGLGLADATITELTAIKALLVRPTAAILRYQNRTVDPLEAGRELGVDAVVDASFQRSGVRLRVTVQLLDTSDGRPLWASKITSSLDDVFDMQDEVSRRIAQALEVELTEQGTSRPARARTGGAAYELYLKGRLHLLRETLEDYNAAIDCFERSRAADPDFAPAYAGLAGAYSYMAFTWDPEGGWYRRAEQIVAEALRLDPDLPEARYVRGRLLWSPDGGFKHAEALKEFAAALAARPGLGEAHDWMGIVLFHVSMLDEAVAHFERALAIHRDDEIARVHLGFCRHLQGSFQAALDISTEARRRLPAAWVFYQVALAEIQLGRPEDAQRTVDLASRQFPGHVLFYPLRGLIAALRGDHDAALRNVEVTARNSKAFGHYHHAQYDVACIHAVLGRTDDALKWLSDASRNGFPCYAFFERDRLLESVRQDAGFTTLMHELRRECGGYRALYHARVA